MQEQILNEYTAVLLEELIPAIGCTEPIAVTYCVAIAANALDYKLRIQSICIWR